MKAFSENLKILIYLINKMSNLFRMINTYPYIVSIADHLRIFRKITGNYIGEIQPFESRQ
jgi:hypothetical protein